jgi:hypothetical protein
MVLLSKDLSLNDYHHNAHTAHNSQPVSVWPKEKKEEICVFWLYGWVGENGVVHEQQRRSYGHFHGIRCHGR